ncbi:hypothetical protein FHL15_005043 [Xylaria flabelliformis]|uniref:GPI inositol-deacylase n=1 Tax=Xylaria flabelliformis TaxID=2512241 RepID=A0A553I185_9PEZI|nr:hypothetical protein FHL15_005043 [Xylaria flabelliformis]
MWKRLKGTKNRPPTASDGDAESLITPAVSIKHETVRDRSNSSDSNTPKGSIFHGQLFPTPTHQHGYSQNKREDPLGLHVLHNPDVKKRTVDILFIHGLGGTSLRTWCHGRDLENLWPQLWLPHEDGFSTARILTYGYNAHFSKKEQASLAIGDFANDLLFRMKYSENGSKKLGQVPIIIVAHSMGGLVFKKAFIHGLLNDEFRDIVSMIKSVLFLATPHRGTDLAETLNKILTGSIFGHSPKDYVMELARKSPTIDELNESFRHHASKLRIFSFYETLSTAIGPFSTMVLEKNTAVLGYPRETPQPLSANHHGVCKFQSREDANYLSVLGALRSVVEPDLPDSVDGASGHLEEDLALVKTLLSISTPPEEDLAVGHAVRVPGTCEHFFTTREFREWRSSGSSQILWVHAPPGSGKSTLCALIVDRILEAGDPCVYFFFKYDNYQKKSISHMLRSFAYQISVHEPRVCHELADLAKSGERFHNADSLKIWKRIFLPILSKVPTKRVFYWVIDGIDESESGRQIIDFLSSTNEFESTIKVLILSRPHFTINQALQRASTKMPVVELPLADNQEDIRLAVSEEIIYLASDERFKLDIVNEITTRSHGNFLWASLVVKLMASCHRQDQVEKLLETTPEGMDKLYDRMLSVVTSLHVPEDVNLARILLSWAMYSRTPLTVEELSEPYAAEFRLVMNLKHTVNQICGQLVTINTSNQVILVHHSAREYLRKYSHPSFSLKVSQSHEELFGKCLVAICDKDLRGKLQMLRVPQFLRYAATSWAFHLENCTVQSDRVLNGLTRFFRGSFPLSWIQYMAMSGHLSDLPGVSRRLTNYVRKRREFDAEKPPMSNRITDLSLIDSWAIDIMKIPAKFGRNLHSDPSLIYKCIPSLSPINSTIFQKFSSGPTSRLSVTGLSNEEWDDCIARVSGSTGKALRLAATTVYLAVASDVPLGLVTVWDTILYQTHKTFCIKERVLHLGFNQTGSLLACHGIRHTYLWKVNDGSLVLKAETPRQERAIQLRFDEHDRLLIVTDLKRVYSLIAQPNSNQQPQWLRLDPTLLTESSLPEGVWLGTPSSVAFNHDCSQIAVAYRNFPLAIWSVESACVVARMTRRRNFGQGSLNSFTGNNKVVWHPSGSLVLGIFGDIFKWSPSEDTYETANNETGVIPHDIECTPNGLAFITGDAEGSIKIYEMSSMTMIYKLASEDGISYICLSPDSTRFYDLRGSYCNVWEPNCLLRLADMSSERLSDAPTDSFWSDTEDTLSTSISFPAYESRADNSPGILAVATHHSSEKPIAYSTKDGFIHVYHQNSRFTIGRSVSEIGIENLEWNNLHDRLAFSDINGTIIIKSVAISSGPKVGIQVNDIYNEIKIPQERGNTRQLLFDNNGATLFIYGDRCSQVISILDGSIVAEIATVENEHATWLRHPTQLGELVNLSNTEIKIFDWNLELKRSIRIRVLEGYEIGTTTASSMLPSYDSRLLLLRIFNVQNNRRQPSFAIIPTTVFAEERSPPDIQQGLHLSKELLEVVAHPVGILSGGRLVFLDKSLWVCTAQLNDSAANITRHFFIPYDWITSAGAELCQVLRDGTFLCPTKGKIAIIKSSVMGDW